MLLTEDHDAFGKGEGRRAYRQEWSVGHREISTGTINQWQERAITADRMGLLLRHCVTAAVKITATGSLERSCSAVPVKVQAMTGI